MKLFTPTPPFESLESRRLLALVAAVNFQPSGSAVPAGYVVDAGNTFASRNGLTYGWDAAITSATRDRNSSASPDQRYDTFIHTQQSGSRKWEIALPNGTYSVQLVAGDPNYFDSVYKFNLENQLALSGTPSSGNRWITATKTVTVSDGRLTLTNASGSSNNKIAFLTISTDTVPPPPPPPPAGQSPFKGSPFAVGAGGTTIQAEDFDNGGEGVAFHDTTSGNSGGAYRTTNVDIQPTTDSGGGYNIGYIRSSEWLEYTIDVASTGTYDLDLRLASASSGRSLFVTIDGVNKTGNIAIPNTGGWQNWTTVRKSGVSLTTGEHVLRIQFDNSSSTASVGNLNWVKLTASTPVESDWSTGANMPIELGEVAGGIINGKLYLVGEGNNATLSYDIAGNSWVSNLATRPFAGNHHAAEVFDGKLYLLGGLGGSSGGKVQIYDPASNEWSNGANMPFAAGSSASSVIGGYIYVAGGIIGSATTTQVARYDPVANTWESLAAMPQGRNHAASATDGSKLYVFGGRGPGSGDSNTVANGFNTVQIYDPSTNSWQSSANAGSTLAPLPQARGGMGKAVYFGGEFYVIGGETSTGAGATVNKVYNRVDIYNPSTNTWRLGEPMPTARHGIFPLLSSAKIYIAGGGVVAGHSDSNVLEILDVN